MANCEICFKADVCRYYEPKSTVACEHYSAPVHHGHWILVNRPVDLIDWEECSVCGYENFYFSRFKFCPNCGAKMEDEEERDENA